MNIKRGLRRGTKDEKWKKVLQYIHIHVISIKDNFLHSFSIFILYIYHFVYIICIVYKLFRAIFIPDIVSLWRVEFVGMCFVGFCFIFVSSFFLKLFILLFVNILSLFTHIHNRIDYFFFHHLS